MSEVFARRVNELLGSRYRCNASALARDLECTRACVSSWRKGRLPSRALMKKLVEVSGQPESWFLGEDKECATCERDAPDNGRLLREMAELRITVVGLSRLVTLLESKTHGEE